MDIPTKVNLALSISSFILAVISIVFVVITIKQNSKMIKNASRAYVSVFGDVIRINGQSFYIVVKNFGCSDAVITDFKCDTDLHEFSYDERLYPFSHMINTSIAPNQSFRCSLDHLKLFNSGISAIHFDIAYISNDENYSDKFTINLDAFADLTCGRDSTKNAELKTIANSLQELNERHL